MKIALDRFLSDYSYYLRMERKLSPNTVSAYVGDVRSFWLNMPDGSNPALVSGDDISSVLLSLSEYLSKRSQARFLSSLRSFFDYLVMENIREDNPCDNVDAPKLGRYIPEVLSVEEVFSIIDGIEVRSWQDARDKAILEVLYGCGLRVSEACNLKISHIYVDEAFVRVVGKGDKERLVPLGESALNALSLYFEQRPEPSSEEYSDYAFLNRFGSPISRVSVFKMVKTRTLLAGVRKEISPHTFRHSFATHLIENGADLRVVQEMLGHESILTTEIYTHIDSRTWQSTILEHHPRR